MSTSKPAEECGLPSGTGRFCARELRHPGACRAASGHWWAKYDAGRGIEFSPLPKDPYAGSDMREVWK